MLVILALYSSASLAKTENYLRQTFLGEKQLQLTFKYPIDKVKHFTIKGHGVVKHVYDIKETSLPKTQDIAKYKAKGVNSFKIGQFNKQTIRVVIETIVPTKGDYLVKGKNLIIFLPSSKSLGKSFVSKKVSKKEKIKKKKCIATTKKKKSLKKKHSKTIVRSYLYKKSRRNKTIILDAGHGGRDIGASSRGIVEKDLTLSMTLKLKKILKRMGYRVLLTRSRDKTMSLKERTEYANRHNGSLFVSIHANAAPRKRDYRVRYKGVEVFYLSLQNSKRIKSRRAIYRGKAIYSRNAYRKMTSRWKYQNSRRLAHSVRRNILRTVSSRYRIYDKGIKRNDFWVLLATNMPSILVETGYLTDRTELRNLTNTYYQVLLVEGIAKGINAYFGD